MTNLWFVEVNKKPQSQDCGFFVERSFRLPEKNYRSVIFIKSVKPQI
ncbi:MAG: hypothetical protein J6T41_06355 [Neisseriaceae bacterium]|nr:hypothetical protein [Neisseriaceae bacterium]